MVNFQMGGRGGMERYVLGLARGLVGCGHEVRLVGALVDGEAERVGVEVERLAVGWVPKWARMAVFAGRVARMEWREGEVVLGFGRTWRQDIHRAGGGCHAVYARGLPWWRRWGLKNQMELALERRLYRGGETRWWVVNAAPIAGQLVREHGVPCDRIRVIHTAVDSERFSPGPAAAGGGDGEGKRRPVLLFVSSNHRRKGLPALGRALASVPDAELWVAGAPLRRGDRRRLAAAGVLERVRAWGEVDDMPSLYRRADWFIHPTLYDACANTVLQSMACECPGLISVADGASEFIRDGDNGILLRAPNESAHLVSQMRRALDLPAAERDRMGQAARATVRPLTWKAHVAAWEALCQQVLAERRQLT